MIDLFYTWIMDMKLKNFKGQSLMYKILKLIVNIVYPLTIALRTANIGVEEGSDIIVSLTSFPARIGTVHITIDTLLRQSKKPERVILWLARNQFPDEKKLPKKLLKMRKRGLEIKFCEDLKSHKKYFYSMKYYPEKIIITVDDDMFYHSKLVEDLYKKHLDYPQAVCCNWGHIITFTENGHVDKYLNWRGGVNGYLSPNLLLTPIGAEGILYPPGCISEKVFDKKIISDLIPFADDLWLKVMCVKAGTEAVRVHNQAIPYFNIVRAQKVTLQKLNIEEDKNDKQLRAVFTKFPEVHERLKKEYQYGKFIN